MPPDPPDSPRDADAPDDTQVVWNLLSQADASDPSLDVDAAWADLAARIDESPASRRAERPARPRHRSAIWRPRSLAIAAVVLLLIGAVAWSATPVTVTTSPGTTRLTTLPDGSTVELNGASSIRYARGFFRLPWTPSARQVTLDGEAYFTVSDDKRPFVVRTVNAQVEVTGTAFNVRTRVRDGTPVTQLTLAAGTVQFRASPTASSTTGDAATRSTAVALVQEGAWSAVEGTGTAPSAPEVRSAAEATAWRRGGFFVRRASLPAVAHELTAHFGQTVTVDDAISSRDAVTLYYNANASLKNILHDISVVHGLAFQETARGYRLVLPPNTSPDS